MEKQYDVLVLIGRFQPVHIAHAEIIQRAASMCRHLILVIGSADQPRTYKNPFTAHERMVMLQSVANSIRGCAVHYEYNIDTIYNDQAWAVRIQEIVAKYSAGLKKIGLIGHVKDSSSYYLNMFPQWELVEVPLIEPLNATNVRDLYFRPDANMNFIRGVVPSNVFQILDGWRNTEEYRQIIREREFIDNYKKQFAGLPYPPIFVTSDAVVIQSGHVLLIKRRAEPGKGLWALPGGFVNANTDRSVQDAAIRELREETGIKVPAPVLVGNIKASKVFDAVDRSARGRTITHAFKIALPDGELPRVKGLDDAEKAQWVPLSEVRSNNMFDDHYEIVQWALGV